MALGLFRRHLLHGRGSSLGDHVQHLVDEDVLRWRTEQTQVAELLHLRAVRPERARVRERVLQRDVQEARRRAVGHREVVLVGEDAEQEADGVVGHGVGAGAPHHLARRLGGRDGRDGLSVRGHDNSRRAGWINGLQRNRVGRLHDRTDLRRVDRSHAVHELLPFGGDARGAISRDVEESAVDHLPQTFLPVVVTDRGDHELLPLR